MKILEPNNSPLVTCEVKSEDAAALSKSWAALPSLRLDGVATADLEMFSVGGYSPLSGFMNKGDCAAVAENMRLENGTVWPIPITLPVPAAEASSLKEGSTVALRDASGALLGAITVEEVFERNVDAECKAVFRTDEDKHPGVALQKERGPFCVAGAVQVLPPSKKLDFAEVRLRPLQTRAEFERRGWKSIVGFQTRNPVHRAHEYIIKCAMEICDGLLLHPLVGATKNDDIPADVRMRCYEALVSSVMPKDRVLLSVLPAPMRYAGPREAILHALVRKNYGCTHFIVGRDHAGVGSYYGSYDAQRIFSQFKPDEIGIQILAFENTFHCKKCGQMASLKTCPHSEADHLSLSGTKVRELLKKGERPPVEFSRPEVADVLIAWAQSAG